ncbi:MAG: VOC family protein [Thermoleophilia bacterium]|nr:VOC family protein [Thermoleophilia bacterium]
MPALHHTGLTVRDLERSLAFYRDALGMEVVMRQEKRGGYLAAIVGYEDAHVRMAHLAYPGDAQRIELFEYLHPSGRDRPGEPRDVGITHVCLLVEDVRAVSARLRAAGVDFYSDPVFIDTGANAGGYGVYVRDPDGITLELFQRGGTA